MDNQLTVHYKLKKDKSFVKNKKKKDLNLLAEPISRLY